MRAVPCVCEFYPGICLTTEEKARKNLSQVKKNLSPSTGYILPKHPHITKHTHTTYPYTHTPPPTHTHTHTHTQTHNTILEKRKLLPVPGIEYRVFGRVATDYTD